MDKCVLCGGDTEQRRITTQLRWGDQLIVMENVPAWVCRVCGETYFDAKTTSAIDALLGNPPPVERTVTVPVYTFAA